MTEVAEVLIEDKPTRQPAKRRPKKRAKPPARAPREPKVKVEPDLPVTHGAGHLSGISASRCPTACTAERCVISTVAVCKHPFMTADNGCGPITMANRDRARRLIKHQIIELKD